VERNSAQRFGPRAVERRVKTLNDSARCTLGLAAFFSVSHPCVCVCVYQCQSKPFGCVSQYSDRVRVWGNLKPLVCCRGDDQVRRQHTAS
jgi:hypothetical protein